MATSSLKVRQVVDWSAAIWASLIAGTAFLLLNAFLLPYVMGGNAWVPIRYFASIAMGKGVLPPPAEFNMTVTLVALLIHFALSFGFGLLLAYIIHRGGLITGIIGGALFGVAIYFINFNTISVLFEQFVAMKSNIMLFNHVVFGALAGGIYEWLEIEEFEMIPEAVEEK